MIESMSSGFTISVDVSSLQGQAARLGSSLDAIADIGRIVEKYAHLAQAQAVQNASGITVSYSSGSFIINRQTGKLVRSIQLMKVLPTYALVKANAEYADAVEDGHKAIDLKPKLMGKTIPIRLKSGSSMISFGNAKEVERRSSSGEIIGSSLIIFRKVTKHSKGWIIPAARGRPFMQAAGESIAKPFQRDVLDAYSRFLNGE
jgi:hypothetical protein